MLDNLAKDLSSVENLDVEIGKIMPIWKEQRLQNGLKRKIINKIEINKKKYNVSQRFLKSMGTMFSINDNIFKYFSPDEVFDRVQRVHPRSEIRLTTVNDTALAMSNIDKPILDSKKYVEMLKKQDKDTLIQSYYKDGVITTTHKLKNPPWTIGKGKSNDKYIDTFNLETPVDGLGLPSVYLSVLRLLCENGLVGYSSAFRSFIQTGRYQGDRIEPQIERVLKCYSNDEGYSAIRQRIEMSRCSQASVNEVYNLTKTIEKAFETLYPVHYERTMRTLNNITGDISQQYAVSGINQITPKKRRLLPLSCAVYDLLVFISELTTHYNKFIAKPHILRAWIGAAISNEFDLEGSLMDNPNVIQKETPDFFMKIM